MTWIVPLVARMSVLTTRVDPLRTTAPLRTRMVILGPASVAVDRSFTTREAGTSPRTTWYSSTRRSAALFLASFWRVAFGTALKAASVGAKTVSFPGPERALTRPACFASESSVVNWPAESAVRDDVLLCGRRGSGDGRGAKGHHESRDNRQSGSK